MTAIACRVRSDHKLPTLPSLHRNPPNYRGGRIDERIDRGESRSCDLSRAGNGHYTSASNQKQARACSFASAPRFMPHANAADGPRRNHEHVLATFHRDKQLLPRNYNRERRRGKMFINYADSTREGFLSSPRWFDVWRMIECAVIFVTWILGHLIYNACGS